MEIPLKLPAIVGFRHPVWSSYAAGMLAGMVDFIRGHEPWRLATENDSFGEMEAVKIGSEWSGDGVILFRATQEELESFHARGMAVVLTSTEGPDLGYPRVVPDNARIGEMAAEHLIECAVPHFAFLARGETFYRESQFVSGLRRYARERLSGFKNKLAAFSRQPSVHYLQGRPLWKTQTWREIEAEVMAFLDTLPKPCGLFVVDDALGAVALRAADRLGLKVPGDLAVIAFGDDPAYCFASFPALSTIGYPAREVGRMAAEVLWRQMNGSGPAGKRVEVSPGPVIARESSDTLAIPDAEIRDLVRHIRLTAPHDTLRVSELADRSHLSLTTIKARFGTLLGHGPKQEIQRVRLAHLKILLADPALSLPKIAEKMNFGSAHELSRFFLFATGQRPSAFREALVDSCAVKPKLRGGVIFAMKGVLFEAGSVDEISGGMPVTGARELLEELLGLRVPMALISLDDEEKTRSQLEKAGLASYFFIVCCRGELSLLLDPYLEVCKRLGLPPAQCIVVEADSEGCGAALSAGARVIRISMESSVSPGVFHSAKNLRMYLGGYGVKGWGMILRAGEE